MGSARDDDVERFRALLAGVTVVLVEDDDDARDMLAMTLEMYGMQVSAHSSAASALVALAETPPDVLVSDLMMPGLDGFSMMRRVRGDAQGKSLRAIALTGYDHPKGALEAGYDRALLKPVEPEALCGAIVDLLQRPRSE
jgi:CheY-like chemotaxis protein